MRVIIEDWGPIERFEYDLTKSVIITYGENNIGKSYAMQVLYLLLKNLIKYAAESIYYDFHYIREITEPRTPVEKLVMNFAVDEAKSVQDITDELEMIYSDRMAEVFMPNFLDSCGNTFGTLQSILEKKPQITLILDTNETYRFSAAEQKIYVNADRKQVLLKRTNSDFHKSREYKTHLDIYICDKTRVRDPIRKMEDVLGDMKFSFVMDIKSSVENVYFLPASRSGIYNGMSSFGPILAELSKSRAYIKSSFQIPSLSEPISDYFMELSSIKGDSPGRYLKYGKKIENAILKGEVLFDQKSKSINYQPYGEDVKLEMTDTSSMVSEISPITAFVKYIVRSEKKGVRSRHLLVTTGKQPKSIIFIEEPEAHLHPANQVALMEIFVELSRNDVQLVMASHSNYIFNKLNNMILAKTLDKESYSPILLKKENGKSKSHHLLCDEFGANDENFADIAAQLYEEREELIQQMIIEAEEKESSDGTDDKT